MVMKRAKMEAFQGTMSEDIVTAKDFLTDLEKRFAKNKKAKTSTISEKPNLDEVQRQRKHKGVHYGNVSSCF